MKKVENFTSSTCRFPQSWSGALKDRRAAAGHQPSRRRLLSLLIGFSLGAVGCRDGSHRASEPVVVSWSQRAYVWQRDWNAPVARSLQDGKDLLDGCVVLGAEVEWRNGLPVPIRPQIDWAALRSFGKPVSLALRVAPYPGPFSGEGSVVASLKRVAEELLIEAKSAGMEVQEFQLDFDCAQKKLPGYAEWVKALRYSVVPVPLVITALPSWLSEPAFPSLAREAKRYVLQVHSVESPLGDERTQICDPVQAKRWVAQASAIGLPFEIALPTYRSYVGYSPEGKLVGVASDSVSPSWPVDTQVKEYGLDATAMAAMVKEWLVNRPAHAEGIMWYRLPVATDKNNWRWPTLRAVMEGRTPTQAWTVRVEGASAAGNVAPNPADLVLRNTGEVDEAPMCRVEIRWDADSIPVAESLPGWEVRREKKSVVFFRAVGNARRLPPEAECAIGWLRLEPGAPFHVEVVPVR